MSGIPYIGSKISLISKAEIRYEGTLYTIDSAESTVTLQSVRSHGTEDRLKSCPIPPRDEVYEYIIFRGGDIKDIHVCKPPETAPPVDPAIIETSQVKPKPPSCEHQPHVTPGYNQYTPFGSSAMNLGGYNQFGRGVAPGSQLPPGSAPQPMQQPQPQHQSHLPPHSHPHGHGHGHEHGHYPPGIMHPSQPPLQQPPPSQGSLSRGPTPTVNVTHKSTSTNTTIDQGCQTTKSRSRRKTASKSSTGSRGSTPTQGRKSPSDEHRQVVDNIEQEQHHQMHHNHQQHEEEHERGWERDNRQQQRFRGGGQNRPRGRGGQRGGPGHPHQGERHPAQMNRGRGRRPVMDRRQKEPLKFETEFDFEESNAKFDKEELEKELKQMTLNDKVVNGDNKETNSQVSEDEEEEDPQPFYDKTKSFFDSISCESTERAKGGHTRPNWREERKLNSETFGVNSTKEFNRHRFGGRGRGGYQQGYRGRGRGRGGRPQSGGRGGRRDYGYNNQQNRQNSGESQRRQPRERTDRKERQEVPAE